MPDVFVRDSRRRRRLRGTPIAAGLDALAVHLKERGYAARTTMMYGQVAGHFAQWIFDQRVPFESVDERKVSRFLDRHLPQCRCPLPGPRTRFTVRAALRHFLEILRREGYVRVPPVGEPCSVTIEVGAFDDYLRDTCGLAAATRVYRRRYAREFLRETFGERSVEPAKLRRVDIERFVVNRARHCCPGSAQVLATSLRSWLRFRQLE